MNLQPRFLKASTLCVPSRTNRDALPTMTGDFRIPAPSIFHECIEAHGYCLLVEKQLINLDQGDIELDPIAIDRV